MKIGNEIQQEGMASNICLFFYKRMNAFFEKFGLFACIMLGLWSTISTAGGSISMGILFGSFLLTGNWREKITLLKHPIIIMIFAFILWELVGALYSHGSWSEAFSVALRYNRLLTIWCVVYFIHGDVKKFYWMIGALVLGILINLISIYLNYYVLPQSYAIKFIGGANWPSAQGHGTFAYFTLVFGFSCLIASRLKEIKIQWRYVTFVLGVIAMIAEIFLNSSRSGYVMELSILVCLLFQARKLWPILGMVVFIITLFGGAYLFSSIFKERVDEGVHNVLVYTDGHSNTTSVGLRLNFYMTTANILMEQPSKLIFGYGTVSYGAVTKSYYADKKNKNPNFEYQSFSNPHNQYLTYLFENGIIGLMLFLGFLYTVWRYAQTLPRFWYSVAWVSLVGISVNMLFNSSFMDFSSIFFVFLVGVLASYHPRSRFGDLSLWQRPIYSKEARITKNG